MWTVLPALLACAPPPQAETREYPTPDHQVDDTGDTGDSAADTGGWVDSGDGPELTVDVVPDQDLDDSWVFALDVLHAVDITLPQSSIDSLGIDPYSFVPADVVVDGISMPQVGVRLRGKIGSFRTLSGKPKFRIDFNRYVADQRLYGLEALSLNNVVVDCSYVKEPLAYEAIRATGAPAPRAAMTSVTVNGSSYGLYVLLEVTDDRFLARSFADGTGNLYDGKYVWYGGGSYTLLDFAEGHDELYELEEGTDVGHADISGVSSALSAAWGASDFYARMGAVLDWDEFHRVQVGEQWAGQNDGYAMNKNNYRVYFDPTTGLANLISWDMDYSFLEDYTWGRSWASPYGNIAYACMADSTCRAAQKVVAAEAVSAIDARDLTGLFDDLVSLTDAAAQADPRRECSWEYVVYYRDIVRAWTQSRSGYMRGFWGI